MPLLRRTMDEDEEADWLARMTERQTSMARVNKDAEAYAFRSHLGTQFGEMPAFPRQRHTGPVLPRLPDEYPAHRSDKPDPYWSLPE